MEQVVRVASDRDAKQKLEVVIHLSLNIGITRMPGIPTFIPRGAFYIHRDIRTIARNKTFFAMLAVPPFFPLLKQPQRRQDALRKVEATARNSSPFVGGIKPARNRCLQFRSAPRFRAIPVFFSSLLFFSFSLLSFFFLSSRQGCNLYRGTRITRVGWRKKRGEGTRSFRS